MVAHSVIEATVATAARPRWSVVMPVLNEVVALPAVLGALAHNRPHAIQVIVADGGSTDASVQAATLAGAHVVHAPRGRARQMNAGAAQAMGQHLLFLHADTVLPEGAWAAMEAALARSGPMGWGRFDVHLVGQHPMLRVIAWFMNHRSCLTGIATGDQAMFMTRTAFDAVGGFRDQPLMEDIEMSARLKRLCRPTCLPLKVCTSGRRWEQRGVWRTLRLMWTLRWLYWRGADPARLAEMYR